MISDVIAKERQEVANWLKGEGRLTVKERLDLPFYERYKGVKAQLANVERAVVERAVKEKSGEVYEQVKCLVERVNWWVKYKAIIEQLEHVVNTEKEREALWAFIRSGTLSQPINVSNKRVAVLLCQLGFNVRVVGEALELGECDVVEVKRGKHSYWVKKEKKEELERVLAELDALSVKVQYYTAEHQVRELTEEEAKEFKEVQQKYLSLLKTKEELLKV
jgi:hypothetical protein